jgi:hypothetical protein
VARPTPGFEDLDLGDVALAVDVGSSRKSGLLASEVQLASAAVAPALPRVGEAQAFLR